MSAPEIRDVYEPEIVELNRRPAALAGDVAAFEHGSMLYEPGSRSEYRLDPHHSARHVTMPRAPVRRAIVVMPPWSVDTFADTDFRAGSELVGQWPASVSSIGEEGHRFVETALTHLDSILTDVEASTPRLWHSLTNLQSALMITRAGFDGVASRLLEIFKVAAEDPDEPDVSPASVQNLVAFLADNPTLPHPSVGLDPNGYVDAEWSLPDDTLIVMVFLPDDRIRCAAVGSFDVSGTLPREDVLGLLEALPFVTA